MKNFLKQLFVLGLCYAVTCSVSADQLRPGLSLFSFDGEQHIDHIQGDPLLLYVSVANMAGLSIARENEQNHAMLDALAAGNEDTEALDQLRDAYPVDRAWQITLGSEQSPISSLLNLQVRNAKGESVELVPSVFEPIEDQIKHGELSIEHPLLYTYAISQDQLMALPEGTYSLAVGIDTRKREGMWQGWAYSKPISLSLTATHPDPEWQTSQRRMASLVTYFLGVNQYQQAQAVATEWVALAADSVDSYSALGDVLVAQGEREQALEAYYTALANFNDKYEGQEAPEQPLRLIDKIDRLDE